MEGAFDVGLGSAFILLAIYAGGMVVKSWRFDIHATTVLEKCAYSPDLAPNDLFLYPKRKEVIEGAHFQCEEVTKAACEGS